MSIGWFLIQFNFNLALICFKLICFSRFDTQLSTSLIGSSPAEIQQASATRLHADAYLSFTNERHAKLQLQNVRIGELNSELPKSQRVQPLG